MRPPDFKITPRMQMRMSLLEMVIRAAGLMGLKPDGSELQKQVEELEQWIITAEEV